MVMLMDAQSSCTCNLKRGDWGQSSHYWIISKDSTVILQTLIQQQQAQFQQMQADRFVPAAQNDRFDPAAGNMKSARFQVDINATDSDLIPSKTDSQETPTCQVQQTDSVTTYTTCTHMSVWFRFKEYNVNHQIPSTTSQQIKSTNVPSSFRFVPGVDATSTGQGDSRYRNSSDVEVDSEEEELDSANDIPNFQLVEDNPEWGCSCARVKEKIQ